MGEALHAGPVLSSTFRLGGEDGGDPLLVAYQIAFDLVESATQEFLTHVRGDLERRTGGSEAMFG